LFDRGFASAPMVEAAIMQLTDDQGDVVVDPVNNEHPLLEKRTTWGRGKGEEGRGGEGYEGSGKTVRHSRSRSPLPPSRFPLPSLRLQLLPTPKTVTVATEPRRDHEIPVRYLDGNEWHDIVEAAGPDRVSGGEWSINYARDYYRCVREDGMMVWLYRGMKEQSTDWFLHGWWD
jgi:hypothetical protein